MTPPSHDWSRFNVNWKCKRCGLLVWSKDKPWIIDDSQDKLQVVVVVTENYTYEVNIERCDTVVCKKVLSE